MRRVRGSDQHLERPDGENSAGCEQKHAQYEAALSRGTRQRKRFMCISTSQQASYDERYHTHLLNAVGHGQDPHTYHAVPQVQSRPQHSLHLADERSQSSTPEL